MPCWAQIFFFFRNLNLFLVSDEPNVNQSPPVRYAGFSSSSAGEAGGGSRSLLMFSFPHPGNGLTRCGPYYEARSFTPSLLPAGDQPCKRLPSALDPPVGKEGRRCPLGAGDAGRKSTRTGSEQPHLSPRGLIQGSLTPFSAHVFTLS